MEGDFISFGEQVVDHKKKRDERSKKRKFQDFDRIESRTTPWIDQVDWSASTAIKQLQSEVEAFTRYIQPTPQEHALRDRVVQEIRAAIVSRWPDAQVLPFGSFQTELYLPSGDIDLVVMSAAIQDAMPRNILNEIAARLRARKLTSNVNVIWRAKVPIVKIKSKLGDFTIDISLNRANGLSVGKFLLSEMDAVGHKAAQGLIFIVKAFLAQRGLNEVFSGGLSSYSVICMVISFLQLHPKLQQRRFNASKNTAVLLLEFLELYGKHFNYDEAGIYITKGGGYYNKEKHGSLRPGSPYLLSIRDPQDDTNDISGGTYNILSVRQSFAGGFDLLVEAVAERQALIHDRVRLGYDPPNRDESLLGSIIALTSDVISSRLSNSQLTQPPPLRSGAKQAVTNGHTEMAAKKSEPVRKKAAKEARPLSPPISEMDLQSASEEDEAEGTFAGFGMQAHGIDASEMLAVQDEVQPEQVDAPAPADTESRYQLSESTKHRRAAREAYWTSKASGVNGTKEEPIFLE